VFAVYDFHPEQILFVLIPEACVKQHPRSIWVPVLMLTRKSYYNKKNKNFFKKLYDKINKQTRILLHGSVNTESSAESVRQSVHQTCWAVSHTINCPLVEKSRNSKRKNRTTIIDEISIEWIHIDRTTL
jgi:hypothetical protein